MKWYDYGYTRRKLALDEMTEEEIAESEEAIIQLEEDRFREDS